MKPEQVLDLQADLMVRSADADWGRAMELHLEADYGYGKGAKVFAEQVVRKMHDALQVADAYFVAPEMTELVMWAAAGLDNTDALRLDEIPTRTGFVYLPVPLQINDAHGEIININALVWDHVSVRWQNAPGDATLPEDSVILTYFVDTEVSPDKTALDIMAKAPNIGNGRWQLVGTQLISEGMRIGPALIDPEGRNMDKWRQEYPDEEPVPFGNITRLMHAYWMLLNQTVVLSKQAEIPRAFAKRARRMSIPDRVTVVALRRVDGGHSHGETEVEWQHRWMVRGHWRWQHVSEHHPLAEPDPEGGFRARVWVRPHIKGPEDKPFVLTDKVYALVR